MQQASGAHEYAGMGEVNPQFVGARGTSSAHAHGHMIGISQEMPDHSHPEHLQQQQQLLQYSHSSQPHRHEQQKTDTLSEIPSPIASRPPPRASTNSFEGAVGSALGSHEDQEAVAVEDIGERSGSAGNRWPRQETLALLKIRSEMDSAFRDATLKGPLWVDVSRKLAELGYYRSAKKCKEKFENVHKYYKRTKDGRAGRQDGKSYRFFSQLEALHGNNNSSSNANIANTTGIGSTDHAIVIGNELADMRGGGVGGAARLHPPPPAVLSNNNTKTGGLLNRNNSSTSTNPLLLKHCADSSACISFSSESSEDEEDYDDAERDNHIRKRKRGSSTQKMMIFFENLMRQVMEKQEIMQQKFLQTIEKREQDRMIREEAWKRQEMARLNREHEIMAHERALSASRDAAFIAFLQKITGQTFQQADVSLVAPQTSNFHENVVHESQAELSAAFDPNSTRWPKPEVLALIKLRSGMEAKYQDAGPKGPLWEEISAGMNRLGFNRSAKRCKEKWENINKYFKKVKESNKKRPEDAKTCPYFHQLDQLYRKRILGTNSNSNASANKLQSDHHTLQEEIIDQQFPRGSNANNPEDKSTDQGQGHGNSDDILVTMPPPPPSSDDNNNNNNNNSCAAASSIIPSINEALPTFYSHPETNAGTGADDQRALKKVKMKPHNVIIDPNFNMSTTTSCASLPDLMSFDHGGKDFTVSTNSESVLKPECLNVMEIMDLADNNIPSTQHQQSILADDYEHDDEMILADDDSDNNLDDSDHHPTEEETHQRTHFHHLPFGRFVHDRTTEPSTHSTRNTTNSFSAMVRNRFSSDRPEFKSSKE